MLPGTAARGPSGIEATFAGFFRSAGAINQVAVTSLTFEGAMVLMTYTVDSERVLVSAGVDTLIVRHGMIVAHPAYLGGLTQR